MSHSAECPTVSAGAAFDDVAESYDATFTRSVIGRAQRGLVWELLARTFAAGDRILELNCGTGEDALFLGRRGVAVEACDGSGQMIEVAKRRKACEGPDLPVCFQYLQTERLRELRAPRPFDGVLSNFSGLNCVQDLRGVASDLCPLVRRGGNLVLCFSSRVCLWEIVWFSLRRQAQKAWRRVRGCGMGRLGNRSVRVWYPSLGQIKRAFSPSFQLRSARAIGLVVPPSYLEFWAFRHPQIISAMVSIDRALGRSIALRSLGDHLLVHFERVWP